MVLQRFLSRLMWGGMAPLLCLALLMLGLHVLQFKTELERQGSALLTLMIPGCPEHPGSWKTLVSARGGAGRGRSNL